MKKTQSFLLRGALAFVVVLGLTACGGTAGIAFPDSYNSNGDRVTAELNHFNFLGFNPLKNSEKVMQDLARKCEGVSNGKVNGISYQLTIKNFFIATKIEVRASGVCCCLEEGEEASAPADDKKKKRRRRR